MSDIHVASRAGLIINILGRMEPCSSQTSSHHTQLAGEWLGHCRHAQQPGLPTEDHRRVGVRLPPPGGHLWSPPSPPSFWASGLHCSPPSSGCSPHALDLLYWGRYHPVSHARLSQDPLHHARPLPAPARTLPPVIRSFPMQLGANQTHAGPLGFGLAPCPLCRGRSQQLAGLHPFQPEPAPGLGGR